MTTEARRQPNDLFTQYQGLRRREFAKRFPLGALATVNALAVLVAVGGSGNGIEIINFLINPVVASIDVSSVIAAMPTALHSGIFGQRKKRRLANLIATYDEWDQEENAIKRADTIVKAADSLSPRTQLQEAIFTILHPIRRLRAVHASGALSEQMYLTASHDKKKGFARMDRIIDDYIGKKEDYEYELAELLKVNEKARILKIAALQLLDYQWQQVKADDSQPEKIRVYAGALIVHLRTELSRIDPTHDYPLE